MRSAWGRFSFSTDLADPRYLSTIGQIAKRGGVRLAQAVVMTDIERLAALDHRPLTDDADLEFLVSALLHKAHDSRVWIMLLDDQWRSTKAIIPIDDLPSNPQAPMAMPSGGPLSAARVFGERIAQVVEQTPAAAVVVIWERPGPSGADPNLLRWVDGMRAGFAGNPRALRAQMVLTSEGVKVLRHPRLRTAA